MKAFLLLPLANIMISMNSRTENESCCGNDYSEIEIGRMTDLDYALAQKRFEAFLRQEREGQKKLEFEFAQELDELLATLRRNRVDPNTDPPGWPDF